MFLVFLAFFLIPTCLGGKKIDYCDINLNHMLCGAEEALENEAQIIHFAPTKNIERTEVLKRINEIRNEVAGGNFVRNETHYPTASNMFQLEWCDICEKAAMNMISRECWLTNSFATSSSCCNCQNTGEMDLFKFMYYVFMDPGQFYEMNLPTALQSYLDHTNDNYFKIYCLRNVSINCLEGPTGFLFSFLNARQVKIGCAFLVCNKTGIGGNLTGSFSCVTNLDMDLDILRKEHYLTLEPASQCPKPYSSPSWDYKNLCKCNDMKKCLIQPAELSSQCTTRKGAARTPLTQAKQVLAVGPVEILNVTMEDATATTKKNVTDSGGAKDKSGVKD